MFFPLCFFFSPAGKAGPCPSIQCIQVTLPFVHMWYHKMPHRLGQRVLLEYDPLGAPPTSLIVIRAPPSGVCLMPDSARRSNVPPPRKGSAARLRLPGGAPALLSLCVGTSSRTPARFSRAVPFGCGCRRVGAWQPKNNHPKTFREYYHLTFRISWSAVVIPPS